jgi:DNA-binding MarR family transcriptional regulator
MNNTEEKIYKRKHKPSLCTENIFRFLVPKDTKYEILRQIKQECLDIYGKDISCECDKRLVCFSKKCIGRRLPWESPTAKPYLDKFTKNQVVDKEGQIYVTDCSTCSIKDKCTYPCYQVNDYTKRNYTREPFTIYKECMDNYEIPYEPKEAIISQPNSLSIPWDCISTKKAEIIKMYVYQQLDFLQIANKLGYLNQAQVKYLFYSALTTMSRVAIMRQFLKYNESILSDKQIKLLSFIYVDNLSLTFVANKLKISKSAVTQMIAALIKKHKITWNKFVWKENGKVCYNVLNLLK